MRLAPVLTLVLAPVLALIALPAAAQPRDSDTLFTADELSAALSGQVLEFFNASLARYGSDGTYTWRYLPDDRPWNGTWETRGSEVCVTYESGQSRCDTIVHDGGRLVMIIEDGTRFPVKSVTPDS